MNNDRTIRELRDLRDQLHDDAGTRSTTDIIEERIAALEEEDRHRPPSTEYQYLVIRLGEDQSAVEYNMNNVPDAELVSVYAKDVGMNRVQVFGVFKRRIG